MSALLPSMVLYIFLALVIALAVIGWYRRRFRKLQAEVQRLAQEKDQWIANETPRIRFGAEEEERKRISQDLHDELGSLLTAIKLNLQLMEKQSIFILHSVEALEEIKFSLGQAIKVVKYTSRQTSPLYLERVGLTSAVNQIANRLNISCSSRVQVEESGVPFSIPQEKELHLFRMIQEIVTNSVNNYSAWKVTIGFRWELEKLVVEIMDDGIALPKEKMRRPIAGMGLGNIDSRSRMIGAKFYMPEHSKGNHSIIELPHDEVLQD